MRYFRTLEESDRMFRMEPDTSLILPADDLAAHERPEIAKAILYWAEVVSDATSPRRSDLIRIKRNAMADFLKFAGKRIDEIGPEEVRAWRVALEHQGLQASTIYTRLSFVSSFFEWALQEPLLAQIIRFNPVQLVRPKAPKPYQSRAIKALNDEELNALHQTLQAQATPENLVGLRDYALWLFFITSGLRRSEVLSLRGCDVEFIEEGLRLTVRLKGGDYSIRQIVELSVRDALEEYLRQSQRFTIISKHIDAPIWLRHDRGSEACEKQLPLAPWSFARQMKKYAKLAGIKGRFHLHQTRHTFARLVAEDTSSLSETQEALGHRNLNTTRIYVQRVGIKADKFSRRIAQRLQRNKPSNM